MAVGGASSAHEIGGLVPVCGLAVTSGLAAPPWASVSSSVCGGFGGRVFSDSQGLPGDTGLSGVRMAAAAPCQGRNERIRRPFLPPPRAFPAPGVPGSSLHLS